MSFRRFYLSPGEFAARAEGERVQLSPDESRHLRDVLRLRPGDEARVFDGAGREYACVVIEAGRGAGATLELRGEVEPPRKESPLTLTLAVSLLKGEKFDFVVQKATELGVARIAPVVTERADVRLRDEPDRKRRVARWQRLALEASKQSGRARVPEIGEPLELARLLETETEEDELRLMFSERGGLPLADGANSVGSRFSNAQTEIRAEAVALVGPEGGWETEEIEDARARGWSIVTLGGRILRAETAALTVVVLLQHIYGDVK